MVNLRVNYVLSEPLTSGRPNLRVNLTFGESFTTGYPNLRVNEVFGEPLTGGHPNLRVNYIIVEVFCPVDPEEQMTTTPFPGFGNSVSNPAIPAGADPFNSALPGLKFSVHKKPAFNTRIANAASGFEVRNAMMEYPKWDFELSYEFLEDRTGAESSLKTIMGFFLSMNGSFNSFLFKDPDDYLCEASTVGEADGVTTVFPICRDMGGFLEQVGQIDTANDINFYLDGVLIDPADYTISMPNNLIFDSAPSAGTITGDFQFFFVCRFTEDQMDFEKFADQLWNLQQCNFRSLIQ